MLERQWPPPLASIGRVGEAWAQLHHIALREASCLERMRRGIRSTGVTTLAGLLEIIRLRRLHSPRKHQVTDSNDRVPNRRAHIPDVVKLLQVFSPEESRFYNCEDNVADLEGKPVVMAQEFEQRLCFVGGSVEEYESYFHRDLPTRM